RQARQRVLKKIPMGRAGRQRTRVADIATSPRNRGLEGKATVPRSLREPVRRGRATPAGCGRGQEAHSRKFRDAGRSRQRTGRRSTPNHRTIARVGSLGQGQLAGATSVFPRRGKGQIKTTSSLHALKRSLFCAGRRVFMIYLLCDVSGNAPLALILRA